MVLHFLYVKNDDTRKMSLTTSCCLYCEAGRFRSIALCFFKMISNIFQHVGQVKISFKKNGENNNEAEDFLTC